MNENNSSVENTVAQTYKQAKKNQRSSLLFFLLIVVVMFIYSASTGSGSIVSQCDDKVLGVAPNTGNTVFIYFEQIKSAELRQNFDFGTVVKSDAEEDAENVMIGTYKNDELGEYYAACYTKPTKCIIVEYDDGILVFNCKNDKLTDTQFEDLAKHLDASVVK